MVTPLIKSPFLFGPRYLQQLFEEGDLCFALEGDFFAIPADALQNPTLLASFAASTPPVPPDGVSPSRGAAMWGFSDGAGLGEVSLLEPALARSVRDAASQASVYWHRVLLDEVEAAGLLQLTPGGAWEDGRRQLPTLAESALLVHLLGLEGADVVPFVLQCNKRDIEDPVPLEAFDAEMNPYGAPCIPAVAVRGDGVFECLKHAAKRVLKQLKQS